MKIAILGAGSVGATLAQRFAVCGHTVLLATRNPDSEKTQAAVQRAGNSVAAATVAEAASVSEVIVVATPWASALDGIEACGDVAGKIIVDATNPIAQGLKLAFSPESSAAQSIAQRAPAAHVVKAFNTVGFEVMEDPGFHGQPAAMLYCGDDSGAKAKVASLIEGIGFDPVDAGGLNMAGLLEAAALLWIRMSIQTGDRQFAFARLHR